MDTNIWQIISIIGFSLAGVMLVAAVLVFIKLEIWKVLGDLSGLMERKQIKAIRAHSAGGNISTNKRRLDILAMERKRQSTLKDSGSGSGGNILEAVEPTKTDSYSSSGQIITEILSKGTEVLKNETAVHGGEGQGTVVLTHVGTEMEKTGTTVLSKAAAAERAEAFVIIKSEISVHTFERI